MNYLLFTHGVDTDGFGSVVLSNLAFEKDNVEVVFAENFELDSLFKNYLNKNHFKDYDKIFITDHCLSEKLCTEIQNTNIAKKLLIFDHHESRLSFYKKFPFINLQILNSHGKCSGTSLFYDYLIEENLLKRNEAIETFVELTRLFDTWQWQQSELGQMAFDLNTYFKAVGREKYISDMTEKLKTAEKFFFSNAEKNKIDEFNAQFYLKLKEIISQIKVVKYRDFNIGIVQIYDDFKNELPIEINKMGNKLDIDFLLLPIIGRETASLRSVKNVSILDFANEFGGGGHEFAGSVPKENILNFLKEKLWK